MSESLYQSTLTRISKLCDQIRFAIPDRLQGIAGGHFTSHSLGSSVDFHDHRVYQPGDDPRHLNWNAFARTDVPMMKTFVEEITPRVDLILDLSLSMLSPTPKRVRFYEWIGFISTSFAHQGVRVKCYDLFGDLPPGALEDFQLALYSGESSNQSGNVQPLALRPQSIRVCISDCLFQEEPQKLLHMLRHQAGAALLICPYLDAEVTPSWEGNYKFIDSESGLSEERRITPEVIKAYQDAYLRHFNAWGEAAQSSNVEWWRFTADGDFLDVLRAHPWSQRWLQQA